MDNLIYIKNLGGGSTGVVDLYCIEKTNQLVAIKKIAVTQDSTKSINREILSLKQLRESPNIISFIDDKIVKNHHWIFLEYCEGGSLDFYLSRFRNLARSQKLSMICDILRAVVSVHRINQTHRDLKPENFLVSKGIVKLCDFGMSRKLATNCENTSCGTPLFMAPEIINSTNYNYKVDIWSLGVISFFIIKGSLPYFCETFEALRQIIRNPINFDGFNEDEAAFLKMALELSPSQRADSLSLIKSEYISGYLKDTFDKLFELVDYLKEDKSTCSLVAQFGVSLYFLSEVLYFGDVERFVKILGDVSGKMGWKEISRNVVRTVLRGLMDMSLIVNDDNVMLSSMLLYVYRRLEGIGGFSDLNQFLV